MTIDNFELIKPLFHFCEINNSFFLCQIVRRAKDHKYKPKPVKEGPVKLFFIRSAKHLESLRNDIMWMCEYYGARAYINVSEKSFKDLQNSMLVNLAHNVTENVIQSPFKIVSHCAGALKSKDPIWIVDIDDISMKDSVRNKIVNLYKEYDSRSPAISIIEMAHINERNKLINTDFPTRNGVHLLAYPFNLKEFHEEFPDISVHKNSMGTLLYYPDSIDTTYGLDLIN